MKMDFRLSRMEFLTRFTVLALGIMVLVPSMLGKKDPYIFRFGLMLQNSQGKAVVYLETTEIEKQVDPSYLHGFTIVRKDGSQFFIYYKVRFPKPLENLPEGIEKYYDILEGGSVLQSKEELVWESSPSFTFEKSDPEGAYQMEIYIDGDLYHKIDYNVSAVPEFDF